MVLVLVGRMTIKTFGADIRFATRKAIMRNLNSKTARKRFALGFLVSLISQSPQLALGELVESTIRDASAIVQAQATTQNGTANAPAAPTVVPDAEAPDTVTQETPGQDTVPGLDTVPSLDTVPGEEATGPDAVPEISDAFADPLNALSPDGGAQPLAPNPSLGAAATGLSSSLGTTAGSYSSAPTMMGDFFGSGISLAGSAEPVRISFFSPGTILSGSGSSAILAFDFGSGTPNDIFSTPGTGVDASGDTLVDRFSINEPIPPTDAPTSPGPGFVYQGGFATYTGSGANSNPVPLNGNFVNGDTWFITYKYALDAFGNGGTGVLLAGPDVASRRVKLSENFSPEVRDRCFINYNFFNDAFGGLGDVNRFVLGFERILVDDLVSIEVRLPMAGTLSSRQQVDRPGDRSYELGNATFIGKFVLLRTDRYLWTAGTGVTAPLADDARLLRGDQELLRIENEAVHLLPFLSVLHRYNSKTFFQAYTQFDVDTHGNPVLANLTGGPLTEIGTFTDSTIAHVDGSAHRVVYQNRRSSSLLKSVIANAELHYSGTLNGSDAVAGQGITIGNLKQNFNIVNATTGAHLVLSKNMVVSPGVSVPLRSGLDKQFDYEAILQLNYIR